eukprot:UN20437
MFRGCSVSYMIGAFISIWNLYNVQKIHQNVTNLIWMAASSQSAIAAVLFLVGGALYEMEIETLKMEAYLVGAFFWFTCSITCVFAVHYSWEQ